jgi:nitrite reductase/ring-hydroxylating ferredoxin subunit
MAERPAAGDQPLLGFLSNEAWDSLLADLNQRIERMEALPEGATKQQVFALLNGIDAMHREALHRLVRLFKEGVLEKVITDPAIHTLMELYDLLPETAAPVPAKPAFPTIPIHAVRAAPPAPLRYPHWVPVPAGTDDLPPGGLRADLLIDGRPLLLARRDDQWFSLDASCAVDGSSLRDAHLSGYTLSCPNHAGCHYDIRDGTRIGGGAGIACHPVKSDAQGRVLIGLDMDFKPALPSF